MTLSIRRSSAARLLLVAGILLVMSGVLMLGIASAQDTQPTPETPLAPAATAEPLPSPKQPQHQCRCDAERQRNANADGEPSNAYCLLCHSQPGLTWTLPSGETLSLTVDHAGAGRFGAWHCQRARRAQLRRLPHQHDLPASARPRAEYPRVSA